MARRARRAVRSRHRVITCVTAVAVTLALGAGYVAADLTDLAPGPLTLADAPVRHYPDPASTVAAAAVPEDADLDRAVDAQAAQSLIDALGQAEGVGDAYSVVVTDAHGGIVASHEADTPREPASTTKTLTAYAAASTLEMSSTLDTETYLEGTADAATLILKGNGDMLLNAGHSDPTHVNGHAGLATLAEDTAAALNAKGVAAVTLAVDDTLFGTDRTPENIEENNEEHRYYTPISTMAVDGGRDWTGLSAQDPDEFTEYPSLSQNTAANAAARFAELLTGQGIAVNAVETLDQTTVPASYDASARLARVSSAPLNEVMAFMLRHSDNTLAQLFGRLTALSLGTGNSVEADSRAVAQVLRAHDVDTAGMTLTSCSGLAPGTRLTARTLAQVQTLLLDPESGAAAAAEGMALPGVTGTVRSRIADQSALGLMRVKTGALGNVRALTGVVSRTGGGALTFAAVVNDPENGWSANKALDEFAAALTKL